MSHQSCLLCAKSLQLCPTFAIPWAVAPRLLCLWDFPVKNTGVGCHALLQRIFLTQGLNPCLLCFLHWQVAFFTTSTTWEGPSHQGMRHLQKHLSLRQPGAGAGGEGSTLNRCQIVMLPPDDAHNTLTKCSSKNWNTEEDDLVTDRIQELLSHLFAMKYEM